MEPQPSNYKPRREVASSQSWPGVVPWVALGFWFIVQFSMFYQFLHREILWAFPGHWDQVRYFQESLGIYRDFITAGLPRGLMHAILTPTPTGNLLCIE